MHFCMEWLTDTASQCVVFLCSTVFIAFSHISSAISYEVIFTSCIPFCSFLYALWDFFRFGLILFRTLVQSLLCDYHMIIPFHLLLIVKLVTFVKFCNTVSMFVIHVDMRNDWSRLECYYFVMNMQC